MEILIRCAEHNPEGEGFGRLTCKSKFRSFQDDTVS